MKPALVDGLTTKVCDWFGFVGVDSRENIAKLVQQAVSDELVKQSRGTALFTGAK